MTYFHGSAMCDLEVGAMLLSANESQCFLANPRMNVNVIELHDDGVYRHDHDVVWITTDSKEAEVWGGNPVLKCTGDDVRQMQQERGGKPPALIVYEVEPLGPIFRRLTPHSEHEYGCAKALVVGRTVLEEYDWRDFAYERNPDGTWTDFYTGETFTTEQVERRNMMDDDMAAAEAALERDEAEAAMQPDEGEAALERDEREAREREQHL